LPVPVLHDEHLADRLRAVPAVAALLPGLAGERGVYAVGGVPRDLLLGGRPLDLDLVVEGDAEALTARLAGRLGGEVSAHGRFGTATLALGAHAIDIASAREERYARPGALPEVKPAVLARDLERRDFTVNALALTLDPERMGEVTAVPCAREDLEAERLRVLHDASFADDPTRLLRLARYAARLGFRAEDGTEGLARRAVRDGALETVSGARIGAELRLLAAERRAVSAFDQAAALGLLGAIDPVWRWDRELAERALAARRSPGARRHPRWPRGSTRWSSSAPSASAWWRSPALRGSRRGSPRRGIRRRCARPWRARPRRRSPSRARWTRPPRQPRRAG